MTGMKFGKVQLKIMNVLWQKKRSTAVEITTEINKTGYYIAHSTVQTHMRALEKKGAVGHDMDDRTFIFYPLVDTDNVARHAVSDMVDTIFSGSAEALVSYIIRNRYLSPNERKKIQILLEKPVRDSTGNTSA